jgi:hypothetical protein
MICENTLNLYIINLKKCLDNTICQCYDYEDNFDGEEDEGTLSNFLKKVKVIIYFYFLDKNIRRWIYKICVL